MRVIQPTLDQIEAIATLFDAYRVFYKQKSDVENATVYLQERMRKKESVIFAVEDEKGQMCGFTQLYPLYSSVRMKRVWLLNDLFVHPTYRGLGVSKLLIAQAKAHAISTHAAGISLETSKDNHIGNHLYPATDFNLDIDHNFYFWENKDIS